MKIHEVLTRALKEKIGCSTVRNSTSSPRGILNRCYVYETDKVDILLSLKEEDS